MNISISRNGVEIGEWTEEEVRAFYAEGRLVSTDNYWTEGMTEWENLASFIKPPPPFPSQPVKVQKSPALKTMPPIPIQPAAILPTIIKKQRKWRQELVGCAGILCSLVAFGLGYGLVKTYSQSNTRKLSDSELISSHKQAFDEIVKKELAGNLPPVTAPAPKDYNKVLKDWLADYTNELGDRNLKFLVSQKSFQLLGETPASIIAIDDLMKRLSLLQTALHQNAETMTFCKNSDAEYVNYLKTLNAPDDVISDSSSKFHTQSGVDKIEPYLESNARLTVDYINLFQLLESNYGTWKIVDSQVVFNGSPDDKGNTQSFMSFTKDINDETTMNATLTKGLSDKP